MNLNTGWAELSNALKELRICWDEHAPAWKDNVRQEFEEEHKEPLEAQVATTLRAIERLSELLIRAQHDCA